jgi:manganese oxidase
MSTRTAVRYGVCTTLLGWLTFATAPMARAQAAQPAPPQGAAAAPSSAAVCGRTIKADIAALDQTIPVNRLGASMPEGMIFALRSDVVPAGSAPPQEVTCDVTQCSPGKVALRQGKRPRPLVLRMNVGDCLEVRFTNYLDSSVDNNPTNGAGFHVQGLQLVKSIGSDASFVGKNPSSLVTPGNPATYTYYADADGVYMAYALDDATANQISGKYAFNHATGIGGGLFGAVNVEPRTAEWYRSQVTREDLQAATFRADQLPDNDQIKMYLTELRDANQARRVAAVEGTQQPLWTLTTVHKLEQTVQTATVVIIDNRLYVWNPTPDGRLGHPIVNYAARYQPDDPITRRRCQPVLRIAEMPASAQGGKCVAKAGSAPTIYHADLTAVITGPDAGRFPYTEQSPLFNENPAAPDRRQPYREFTIIYFNSGNIAQAFAPLEGTLGNGGDGFGINYGVAGIGAEIVANRTGVGPMGSADAVDLKFEEFFLGSWAVGDPAILVDVPANTGKKATKALYPDDPSNVYHSYMRDHVKFRVINASAFAPHVHHQHAHQWLHTPNSDNSHYLDSQMVVPGSTYTLEMVYNGSGNRNQTVGDSIFHCHFYPHFAQGMWSLWRVHDVFEDGTLLDANGVPVLGWNRALPDGEIEAGTPVPALVPLPTLGMAPIPSRVRLTTKADGLAGRRVILEDIATRPVAELRNPGFPFFIPGVAGHRAPHPPMDFGWEESEPGVAKLNASGEKTYLDGGLPRHLVLDGKTVREYHTQWDFTKDFILYNTDNKADPKRTPIAGGLVALQLPELGTKIEQVAMAAHATRTHRTFLPNGDPGNFILNGLPPAPGAPFADPSVDDNGNSTINTRRYKAAAIQTDVVFNKKGWHYPQQRFLSLWGDVAPSVTGERPAQPFFFRAKTGETVEFWHTNLVPDYYELDDFQVRTPTDILGQHIHLVKFDVTASDGAGNGFNYEDGTFSPDEVRGRIDAINMAASVKTSVCGTSVQNGIFAFDPATQFIDCKRQAPLKIKPFKDQYPFFGTPPPFQNWNGAQTTVQRYDQDPLLNNSGVDRTLRTVFTHDHFGPSTHQQAGLYAGMLVEPEGSRWQDPVTGDFMGTRVLPGNVRDGGPTSWQANIITTDPAKSFREFALEFQDMQLAYVAQSRSTPGPPMVPMTAIPTSGTTIVQDLNKQVVSPQLKQAFSDAGITLHDGSVRVRAGNSAGEWLITDSFPFPATQGGALVEGYRLVANNTTDVCGNNVTACVQLYLPTMNPGWADPANAIQPAGKKSFGPGLISFAPNGTFSLNYRNEPLPFRVTPAGYPTAAKSGAPAPAKPGAQLDPRFDLSYAFQSIARADTDLNRQPKGTQINPNCKPSPTTWCFKFPSNLLVPEVRDTDPFTPMLRAYENDRVEIRTLVGAHVQSHSFQVHGIRWLSEPDYTNSGYRNAQPMGLSEHFEMLFQLPRTQQATQGFSDYLYAPSSGTAGLTNGVWGIMRAYQQEQRNLVRLPNDTTSTFKPRVPFVPPSGASVRTFNIVATSAKQALPNCVLTYNSRGPAGQTAVAPTCASSASSNWILNPDGLVFLRMEDLFDQAACISSANTPPPAGTQPCRLKAGIPIDPLILRAAAGDWIQVNLTNVFPTGLATGDALAPFDGADGPKPLPPVTYNASVRVGIHPQVVSYDITAGNGINVGLNPDQTVGFAKPGSVYWYAGFVHWKADGTFETTPAEFGTTNLVPSDPLVQHTQGLIGGLIIEPLGSKWVEDANSRASAIVSDANNKPLFREFAAALQVDANLWSSGSQLKNQFGPVGSYNYGNELVPYRFPPNPTDLTAMFSNTLTAGQDPKTPTFQAAAGLPVRFRMLFPGGDGPYAINIHGHSWQELPWIDHSRTIGDNPQSQVLGSVTVTNDTPVDLVLPSAGGAFRVPGDYFYGPTSQAGGIGTWGVFRVTPSTATISRAQLDAPGGTATIAGHVMQFGMATASDAPVQVVLEKIDSAGTAVQLGTAVVDRATGAWSVVAPAGRLEAGDTVRVTAQGATYTTTVRAPDTVSPRLSSPEPSSPASPRDQNRQ